MLVTGSMLTLSAFISIVSGSNLNNDYRAQIVSIIASGKTNSGDFFIVLGILMLLIGFGLIGLGVYNIINIKKLPNPYMQKSKGLAILGLDFGISSILGFGLFFAIPGVIISANASSNYKNLNIKSALSKSGLIVSAIGLGLSIFIIGFLIVSVIMTSAAVSTAVSLFN